MTSKKEKQMALYYLNNIVNSPVSKRLEEKILSWVESNAKSLFGIDLENAWDSDGREKYRHGHKYTGYMKYERENDRKKLIRSIKTIRSILSHHNIVDIAVRGYDRFIDTIFDVFKVPSYSQAFLRYLIYSEIIPFVYTFDDEIGDGGRKNLMQCRKYSAIIGMPLLTIEKNISRESELIRSGIIKIEYDGDIGFSDSFKKVINSTPKPTTETKLKKLVFGKTAAASLTRSDFSYIADEYDHIRAILNNAVKKRVQGVNILIYGAPGTGKTELCKAIAKDIGVNLYSLSEDAENDKYARIYELSMFQTLLSNENNSAVMFDEAEDVFSRSLFVENKNSKLYFNRMLENNKTPVIWISNKISSMDAAYIRRFKYALEVKKPDQRTKETIWKKICNKHSIKLSLGEIAEYAGKYDIAPSFIDTAVGAAKLVESNNAIERTIDALQKATNGFITAKKNNLNETVKFLPELLNTDIDLNNLTEKLTKKSNLRFSLCLYGVPGTGKSAFARYLADKMGLKVIQKRASDLIDCYVGETEKNIANAFREAADAKSVLVFDEADSFLRDRKQAQRSWETTQVNEMLTWMESHPYPFICTTNLMRDLDEASLRRFTFKVKYEFLKKDQVEFAFKQFFGVETCTSLAHLTHLTPGDFAVVRSKQSFLDITDKTELVRMLESEQGAKGVKTIKMGFA